MAPFTTLEALEKTIRLKHENDKHALFEAVQLASIGTNLYEMTGQQRFAFVGASLRKPEALAWYNYLKLQRGIGTFTKQTNETILRQDRTTVHGSQLPDGCRLKDEATLQRIAGIPDPDEAYELFKVCYRSMLSEGGESWRHHHLIEKYKDRLAEVRRWYLVYLMAHGPPPGPNTVDYARIGENLTKQVNDLLDAGKDVPIELLNKLDDFNNSPPQNHIISGKQALVQKARPAVQPVLKSQLLHHVLIRLVSQWMACYKRLETG